jgi:hypothetical protein
VCGGVLVGKLQAVLVDVDADDLAGAEGLGDSHAKQADGAGTEDNDAVTRLDVTLAGNVNADGQRLDESALL